MTAEVADVGVFGEFEEVAVEEGRFEVRGSTYVAQVLFGIEEV